jgi:hypothetical protein
MQRLRLLAHEQVLLHNLILVRRSFLEVARWGTLLKDNVKDKAQTHLRRI